MGFFPNLFRNPSPAKIVSAVLTGGVSVVAPKLIPKAISAPLRQFSTALTSPKTLLQVGAAAFTKNPAAFLPTGLQGVKPMALNVGGILGQVGTIFGGGQNQVFSGISNVANLASQFFPQPVAQPVAQRMPMPGAGQLIPPRGLGRVGGAVGRGFFNRYPNLAAVLQRWRDLGHKVTRAQLYSMLKRWGPEILVSGGILTAAAVSELMVAGPGHRRMNAGNAKALRRSLRRLEAFHTLCVRADKYRGGGRRRSKPCKTGSAAQFVRQG
jgi:hypothetical protein